MLYKQLSCVDKLLLAIARECIISKHLAQQLDYAKHRVGNKNRLADTSIIRVSN